jgi:hypothetical protein
MCSVKGGATIHCGWASCEEWMMGEGQMNEILTANRPLGRLDLELGKAFLPGADSEYCG